MNTFAKRMWPMAGVIILGCALLAYGLIFKSTSKPENMESIAVVFTENYAQAEGALPQTLAQYDDTHIIEISADEYDDPAALGQRMQAYIANAGDGTVDVYVPTEPFTLVETFTSVIQGYPKETVHFYKYEKNLKDILYEISPYGLSE